MAKVTVIPSTINPITQVPLSETRKRKVAAYARVSTDSDEQYTSYTAQVGFYEKYIKEKPEWEFVKVYADEGISGTSTKNRDEFNLMINDALEGKIDLIITKSISRFARNTLDTLTYIRKLKKAGIECYFEKENLWTLDPKCELILTIMASMAQEESRSISQNVTWGKRVAFQNGQVSWAYKNFLGYRKNADGQIEIVESEAELVRKIYQMYLVEGLTTSAIAKRLRDAEVPTPSGKSTNWSSNNILSILTNEKYKGDALLQKRYTVDFLEHSMKKNVGEIPQYYVSNSHPAIIDADMWEQVQAEILRRSKIGPQYSSITVFSSKLICEDCGAFYGKKVWHSTDKYSKEIYQCNKKFAKGKAKCQTPTLTEEQIKEKFIKAYNIVIADKQRIVEDTREIIDLLTDTSEFDEKIQKLNSELDVVSELVSKMVRDNLRVSQSQTAYLESYNEMERKYNALKSKLDALTTEKAERTSKAVRLNSFITNLQNSEDMLLTWNDDTFRLLVESGTVHRNGSITFRFYNGNEIKVD